ncbi:MAG: phosphonate metabolism protein/1,5-bisphosphokinase (PRPP-forming) PhnN [Rubricella sp.]
MTGVLVAVVGPSGSGKDTLMSEAAALRDDIRLARRVITRGVGGNEAHDSCGVEEFRRRVEDGAFALHWEAHGLHYGIPVSVLDDIARGHTVLANLSRRVLPEARRRFTRIRVLSVIARPEVLAARLAARGRESGAELESRLARSVAVPPGPDVFVVDNSGTVEDGRTAFLAALPQPVRG